MNGLPGKFKDLESAVNNGLVEREAEVHCAVLALVAGVSYFMVGTPGIAKSLLVRRIAERVEGARFFAHTMDRSTVPDDLFGPRSLSALKKDRWERVIDGSLVTADFAMLDEFFEAPSTLLKTLLEGLNERTFHQGTEVISMNLTTVFAASNLIPTDDRLAAIYDRLLIRREVGRIEDVGAFVAQLGAKPTKAEVVMAWAEIAQAQEEASLVDLPESVRNVCGDIREELARNDIFPSDRRFIDAMRVVRASAWLAGRPEATVADLQVLSDILWNRQSQIPTVGKIVHDLTADSSVALFADLNSQITEVFNQIVVVGLGDLQIKKLGNELMDKAVVIERAINRFPDSDDRAALLQNKLLSSHRNLVRSIGVRLCGFDDKHYAAQP